MHKHCGECKGCYGYHYPECSERVEGVLYDNIAMPPKSVNYSKRIAELEEQLALVIATARVLAEMIEEITIDCRVYVDADTAMEQAKAKAKEPS